MKFIILSIILLSQMAIAQACGENQPKWYNCSKDSECMIGPAACGKAAYNKNFSKEAEKYAQCLRPMVECAENPNSPAAENVIAKCVEKKCVLGKK